MLRQIAKNTFCRFLLFFAISISLGKKEKKICRSPCSSLDYFMLNHFSKTHVSGAINTYVNHFDRYVTKHTI